VGGSPVVGARRVRADAVGLPPGPPLRPGEIVVVSVSSSADAEGLDRCLEQIERERLAPVPLSRVAAARPRAGDHPG